MCRLSAITATEIPKAEKTALMHLLMVHSNADNQDDGSGVSDGICGYKGREAYFRQPMLQWYMPLDPNQIWIGHVRSASTGTEISDRAAHPFMFDLSQSDAVSSDFLTFAHNGAFRPPWVEQKKLSVSSDSYWAALQLVDLMRDDPHLPMNVIFRDWVAAVEDRAAFAVMVMYRGKLYTLRNSQRTLHRMRFGNGYIINTAKDILVGAASSFLGMFPHAVRYFPRWSEDNHGVESLSAEKLACWSPGEQAVQVWDLPIKEVVVDYTNAAYSSRDYVYGNYKTPSTSNTTPSNSTNVSTALTTLRSTQDLVAVTASHEVWRNIRQLLAPMREGLATIYMNAYMRAAGKLTTTGLNSYPLLVHWYEIKADTLKEFAEDLQSVVFPPQTTAFSPHAEKLIEIWNDRVSSYMEVERFWDLFNEPSTTNKESFFWEVSPSKYEEMSTLLLEV